LTRPSHIEVPDDFGIRQSLRSALWCEATSLRGQIMRDRDGLNIHPDLEESKLQPRLEWIEALLDRLDQEDKVG
jgi:hypothetical protein